MTEPRHRSRSAALAIVALALSAGLVAGREMPEAADRGLSTAAEAATRLVPVGPPAAEEAPPAAANSTPGDHANHGTAASDAARAYTPDGFRNHGADVSSIARGDAGKPDAAGGGQGRAGDGPGQAKAAHANAKGGPNR